MPGYDDPTWQIRREAEVLTLAAAAGTNARSVSSYKRRIYGARATVVTAGTTATHAYIVRDGVTGIGTLTLGTAAAGVTTRVDFTDYDQAAGAILNSLCNGDATGVALVTYEYSYTPDNSFNA